MLKPAEIKDWQDYYKRTNFASFFQSPEWSEIWKRYMNHTCRPAPLFAELPSGKTVLVPLTCQNIAGRLGTVWHAAPAGTYGGWLSAPEQRLSVDESLMLVRALFAYCKSLTMRVFPFAHNSIIKSELEKTFITKTGKKENQEISLISDRTHVMDCSQGFDVIQKQWSSGRGSMKRKIQKADRAGISIRNVENETDRAAYYNLYLDNVHHWKPPPSHVYRAEIFKLLSEYPDRCEIWIAEKEKQILAGAVILIGNQHTAYWHGVSNRSAQSLRPMNLLLSRLIERTCKRGHQWFDFNPSSGIAGVESFKKSFGAESVTCPVLKRTSGWIQLISEARRLSGIFCKRNPGS